MAAIIGLGKYAYHLVPPNLQGEALLPLHRLKEQWPDVYAQAVKKYDGRENLMEARVPILNCLWNDVIHLSPTRPETVARGLRGAGDTRTLTRKWLKIPIGKFDGLPVVELDTRPYMYRAGREYEFAESDVRRFNADQYQELDEVPAWTLDYYKGEISNGRSPLLFNGALHILVQGPIRLSGVEILEWEGTGTAEVIP